nr:ribonuclease H-like domain-containing protein [Tanacetum cinerariifolium]
MRLFRCPDTIFNTKDHLGKFDGKADEGVFVGYSLNSKAFSVFNSRTRIVTNNVNSAGTNGVNAVGENISIGLLFDLNMPALEDVSTFDFSNDDEDDGAMADMSNFDTTIQ